jgi:Animal haem peroxidase
MKLLIAAARRLGIAVAIFLDRWIGWHRFPSPIALMLLVGIRSRLRDRNLVHTSLGLPSTGGRPLLPACRRTADGTFNDLRYPAMGAAGTPLGRNVPLEAVHPDRYGEAGRCLSVPSPRQVSSDLLARTAFVPAGPLNVLAAAWIQFMVHDWFSHGPTPAPGATPEVEIPLDDHDPWKRAHGSMRVPLTPADPTQAPCAHGLGPSFLNTVTHWWDASQLYGSDHATLACVRGGARHGKIRMDGADPRLLPLDPHTRLEVTGFNDNWWVGLSLLHALFASEHNAICDYLRDRHRGWTEEDLFAHARLITAAVIAKIHTVEWSPAILDNRTAAVGLRGTWSGLAREGGIYKILAAISGHEVGNGIPTTPTAHHGAPYSMTEEFVAVYRMHSLLPDRLHLCSPTSPRVENPLLADVLFGKARAVIDPARFSLADVAYSLGRQQAGAITLHNYPNALRELKLDNGRILDLAAVDIFRDRERGLPRYNAFRRLVGRRPIHSFGQLVGREGREKKWDRELQAVYGDIENVDLMVGLFAEPKPPGFGFSDTAFRIFLLMAGRRLKSDRFFTTDFKPEVYSREGMEWIERRTMAGVIADHFSELKSHVAPLKNPFHLWNAPENQA